MERIHDKREWDALADRLGFCVGMDRCGSVVVPKTSEADMEGKGQDSNMADNRKLLLVKSGMDSD